MKDDPAFGEVTSRVRFLAQVKDIPGPLFRAYVRCLRAPELHALAWWLVDRDTYRREFHGELLKDGLSQTLTRDERELVKWLMQTALKGRYPRDLRAAYYVQIIGPGLPTRLRRRVIGQLLDSPRRGVRARGLRHLRRHWDHTFGKRIEEAWTLHPDRDSAKVIIEHGETEFLVRMFEGLAAAVPESGHFQRLCMRVLEVDRTREKWLRGNDPITFLYVMGELGKVVPEAVARDIYLAHRDSYRAGVILWALGRLGHWDLIRDVDLREREELVPIWRGFS